MRTRGEWGREANPTWEDLKRLGWAVLLIEAAVAGLAYLTREYFGARTAIWVGLGLGGLVLASFILVATFSLGVNYAVDLLARRRAREADRGGRASGPPSGPAA